jgi:hypothetical protein
VWVLAAEEAAEVEEEEKARTGFGAMNSEEKNQQAYNKQKQSHNRGSCSQSRLDSGNHKARSDRVLFVNQNLRGCTNDERLEMRWSQVRVRQALATTVQETLGRTGCMLITNGLTKIAGESLQHVGVGIALDPSGVAAWKAAGQVVYGGYASARVIGTRLLLKDTKGVDVGVHLVSAHAPHSRFCFAVWGAWLLELQDCIDRKDKNDVLIIAGMDANAAFWECEKHQMVSTGVLMDGMVYIGSMRQESDCNTSLIARNLRKFRRTSRNRRYAPAGHLLRGVWPSTMYNDHAL